MAKVRVELNHDEVRRMLRSDEATQICQKYADKALAKLGEGYSSNSYKGENRVNVQVQADWHQTVEANKKSNTIIKAVLAARD